MLALLTDYKSISLATQRDDVNLAFLLKRVYLFLNTILIILHRVKLWLRRLLLLLLLWNPRQIELLKLIWFGSSPILGTLSCLRKLIVILTLSPWQLCDLLLLLRRILFKPSLLHCLELIGGQLHRLLLCTLRRGLLRDARGERSVPGSFADRPEVGHLGEVPQLEPGD